MMTISNGFEPYLICEYIIEDNEKIYFQYREGNEISYVQQATTSIDSFGNTVLAAVEISDIDAHFKQFFYENFIITGRFIHKKFDILVIVPNGAKTNEGSGFLTIGKNLITAYIGDVNEDNQIDYKMRGNAYLDLVADHYGRFNSFEYRRTLWYDGSVIKNNLDIGTGTRVISYVTDKSIRDYGLSLREIVSNGSSRFVEVSSDNKNIRFKQLQRNMEYEINTSNDGIQSLKIESFEPPLQDYSTTYSIDFVTDKFQTTSGQKTVEEFCGKLPSNTYFAIVTPIFESNTAYSFSIKPRNFKGTTYYEIAWTAVELPT